MGNKIPQDITSGANEEFIRKYLEEYKNEFMEPSETKRLVFISLVGLIRTWTECPPDALYHSIFLLPLKKKWIYHPKRYANELQQYTVSQDVADEEFIRLLKWKDSQGLAFWLKDYSQIGAIEGITHPFWSYFSDKLSNLNDPTETFKHSKLNLDEKWWENEFGVSVKSKYRTTKEEVLDELNYLAMKYKTMQEILYQSNENSLKPIKAYSTY